MVHVSGGRGFQRFTLTVKAGQRTTLRLTGPKNLAAKGNGARILSASDGSLNDDALIDGTEATNWAGVNDGTNVDETGQHPFVVVDLAGGVQTVRRVQVSAMLRPAPADPSDVPLAADPDSGSRFTALRRFALEACTSRLRQRGRDLEALLHLLGRRLPGRPAAAGGPEPDHCVASTCGTPRAAAIRFVALENQCTGFSGYAGEQDNDPRTTPTARRRRTAGSRCALRSCRSTDPAPHPHRGDGQAPGPCPPPRCSCMAPSPDP